MNWRHIALAFAMDVVRSAIHPLGGIFFPPVEMPGWDPVATFLTGSWVCSNLAIVYGVLVADAAFDDGIPAFRAYGLLVVAFVVVVPNLDRLYFALLPQLGRGQVTGSGEGGAQLLWWTLVVLYESGFGVSIYAYWRVTQRALGEARAAETGRMLDERRVKTTQLLTLQSRVEPELLFDGLAKVGRLHGADPVAADELLADLIALLRSIQPGAGVDSSTVQKEFELVRAWLRVVRSVRGMRSHVLLQPAPESLALDVAPMLILPLLRATLAVPGAEGHDWRIVTHLVGRRLVVILSAQADVGGAHDVLRAADLASLQARVLRLFGPAARLAVSQRTPSLVLDLPPLLEHAHDHRADRRR